MKDIHPLRGLSWVVLSIILSSITAEGIINKNTDDLNSYTTTTLFAAQDTFTNYQAQACSQEIPPFPLKLAGLSKEKQVYRENTSSPNKPFKIIIGSISDNLYSSAVKAGLHPSLILDLADIFSSYIDFATDIRKGDTFSVVLGTTPHPTKAGSKQWMILAAKVTVQGETYEAFFFQPSGQKGAYYDGEGKSLARAFLKAPLQYRRISSMFTKSRFHPILRIYRPHFGIDYAAPTGTPVSAIGAGKIVFMGRKGGFGNLVEIKHNGVYSSSYGHLSRFAKGLRVGKYVERGEVIGYVGSTGLSTGPHLDFRFYANGRPVNFMAISDSIPMESIPKALAGKFKATAENYRTLITQEEARKVVMKSQ
ncbi:MAG: peptidoglycan DD-metalloendopeptidase family protein [Thermodesulforhabdaceae bacterium]